MDNCFSTSNICATVVCNITHYNATFFPKSGLQCGECSHGMQLLAECEHVGGLKLHYGLHENYCINHRYLHVTESIPHTAHLTEVISPGFSFFFILGI
jgi:hypothetical protein